MATEYKGFNIPEKVIIVKREISTWKDGKRVPTGEYQGYVVPSDSGKMLETALNWAGCTYEYKDGKYEYPDKDTIKQAKIDEKEARRQERAMKKQAKEHVK